MTTATPALPNPVADDHLSRLSPVVLLSIYAIVPVVFLLVLADYLGNDLGFSRRIAFNDHTLLLVGLFLQTPHSFASLFTFFDREYASTYRGKLARCVLVAAGSVALIQLVGESLFSLCLVTYNFYHQAAQQTGIAALVARNKSRPHETWRWMSMAILWTGFIAMMVTNNPKAVVAPWFKDTMLVVAALFLAAFAVVSYQVARNSKTGVGRLYVAATSAMLYLYVGLYFLNLPLFMIFVPVFVHDISAFAFYINHNTNRNRETKHNFFSRLRNVLPMPEYLLTPGIALLFGTIYMTDFGISFYIYLSIILNMMHFYIEGVMWKADSLHRRYIRV